MSAPLTEFTPFAALAGGGLIGLAAVLLMIFDGRVAGISGILGGLLPGVGESDRAWRGAFVAGALVAPAAVAGLSGHWPTITVAAGPAALVVGGLLVGLGTGLGSGCTSGHGVCGMARLSGRSISATLTFMVTAAVTVFLLRHVLP